MSTPSAPLSSIPQSSIDAHHAIPTFVDTDTVVNPTQPVLYLPPKLSSLPQEFSDEETTFDSSSPSHVHTAVAPSSPSSPSIPLSQPQSTPVSPSQLSSKLNQVLKTASRLPTIDAASLALHRALHHFQPVDAEYAKTAYKDAFNWKELVLPEDVEGEWYCVAFRSRRASESDSWALYENDRLAHEEAVQNGGLVMYWYGTPHPVTRDNLATCIWQSRAQAVAANSNPAHAKAALLARDSYDMYILERHVLRKEYGSTTLTVHPYTDPIGRHADTYKSKKAGANLCPISGASATEGSCPVSQSVAASS